MQKFANPICIFIEFFNSAYVLCEHVADLTLRYYVWAEGLNYPMMAFCHMA